ncbi:MAG: DUF3990 domain-containing protein [Lachnospiraceae bacterium]|nr:DUF3990 domain-containing protein [Lachnospiraceae bacterium]
MILYHGSEFIIDKPLFGSGKPYNDYGRGFYCTEYPDMAREWSVTPFHDGYLNKYELDISELKILNLNRYPVMTWLAVLLANRTFETNAPLAREAKEYILKEFLIDYSAYDCIIGYRADDSYFSFAQDFISGVISYEQLGEAMKLGRMGDQFVLKSEESFNRIRYTGCEKVSKQIWLPKKVERDTGARSAYTKADKRFIKGALYVIRIIEEEIKRDDERIQ